MSASEAPIRIRKGKGDHTSVYHHVVLSAKQQHEGKQTDRQADRQTAERQDDRQDLRGRGKAPDEIRRQ